MSDEEKKIQEMVDRLDLLSKRQAVFQNEIRDLRKELFLLEEQVRKKSSKPTNTLDSKPNLITELPPLTEKTESPAESTISTRGNTLDGPSSTPSSKEGTTSTPPQEEDKELTLEDAIEQISQTSTKKSSSKKRKPKTQSEFEKFIGENLISKIGIAILVIGVGIGGKYAIDNELINPLTRIVLGYVAGLGLFGTAVYLKKKYEKFSAVLLSGAMAIMYFITFFAYDLYQLIPQIPTFALMVVFTIFTVIAAINYNQQIIALIGLVGAYGIPFLLSDGSGRVHILYTYMAVINIGILAVAVQRYWKILYYAAFVLTWLVFLTWLGALFTPEEHTAIAMGFSVVFFAIFYGTFIAYKLLKKEPFLIIDVIMVMGNAFIYYGANYFVMEGQESLNPFLGIFTAVNAAVHLGVGATMKQLKLVDKGIFYLMGGLTLVFITTAIPVQLDGNWVTLLWAGEAAILFWIGRVKQLPIYERIAYPLMGLAFFSIIQDWQEFYHQYSEYDPDAKVTPIFNIQFLSSLLVSGFFVFINWIHFTKKQLPETAKQLYRGIQPIIPGMLVIILFFTFAMEISNHWDQQFHDSKVEIPSGEGEYQYNTSYFDYDLREFQTIWLINYSLIFIALLSFINVKFFKSKQAANINLVLNVLTLLAFLTGGLYAISELRESYISQFNAEYFVRGSMHLAIRYVSIACFIVLLIACYLYTKQTFLKANLKMLFDFALHTSILWIASSELITWMDLSDSEQSYKLGLSILWGIYSLMLIALGIWKRKAYLRFAAMGLFGITLLKLFFYDLQALNTLAKTVVFVCLGILLLIISFLYNKYKNQIGDEDDQEEDDAQA